MLKYTVTVDNLVVTILSTSTMNSITSLSCWQAALVLCNKLCQVSMDFQCNLNQTSHCSDLGDFCFKNVNLKECWEVSIKNGCIIQFLNPSPTEWPVSHRYNVITNGDFSNFENDGRYKSRQVTAGITESGDSTHAQRVDEYIHAQHLKGAAKKHEFHKLWL